MFPGRASDEILKQYPPTVLFTAEYDFVGRDSDVFAERLKKVGRLAEYSRRPGTGHGYPQFSFKAPENILYMQEEKLAFKHLVEM